MKWSLLALGLLLLAVTVVPWIDGIPLLTALAVVAGIGLVTPQRAAVCSSWRGLLRLPLLLPLLLLPLFGGLFLGAPEATWAGVPFSRAGLLAGTWLALRLLALFLAGAVFSAHVSPYTVARLLERLGLHGLGFSLGLALNALPTALRAVSESWQALRLRGGLRRSWWQGLRLFLVNATVRVVCQGEEVLQAAQLRGHGPRLQPLPRQPSPSPAGLAETRSASHRRPGRRGGLDNHHELDRAGPHVHVEQSAAEQPSPVPRHESQ